jgi:hypothetical protein
MTLAEPRRSRGARGRISDLDRDAAIKLATG